MLKEPVSIKKIYPEETTEKPISKLINATDKEGMTPLMWAAYHGNVSHIEALIHIGNSNLALQDCKTTHLF